QETKVIFDYPGEAHTEEQLDEYLWKRSSFEELLKTLRPAIRTAGHRSRAEAPRQLRLVVSAEPGEYARHSAPAIGLEDPLAVQTQAGTPDKKIFSTLDRFLEMQEIARSCKAVLVRHGSSPHDLLVAARDLRADRGSIEAAFDEAAIPYFIDESVSLRELPLVQIVLTLLRLAIEEFPRAGIVTLVRSPYLNLRELGLGLSDAEVVDQRSWAVNVVSGRAQWSAAFRDPAWTRIHSGLERLFDQGTPPFMAGKSTHAL